MVLKVRETGKEVLVKLSAFAGCFVFLYLNSVFEVKEDKRFYSDIKSHTS